MRLRNSVTYADAYARLRALRDAHPRLHEPLRMINKLTRVRPAVRFTGWGMSTEHSLPWDAPASGWWRDLDECARRLEFTGEAGIRTDYLDALRWRHWFVSWAVRYATTMSTSTSTLQMAECGVADGTTAFFALGTAQATAADRRRQMHLYDAWGAMRAGELLPTEQVQAGRYRNLSLEMTQRNLERFGDDCVYHVGTVPDSFDLEPDAPEAVDYVHIDLNSAGATRSACEFFWPRLVPGGVMLFDDYGWLGFEDTQAAVDAFFADKEGILLPLPTAQAAFLRTPARQPAQP